jgi:Asp-tRNA(Asn)/Glu-tRNA(Gln) amidotransferase B subunit
VAIASGLDAWADSVVTVVRLGLDPLVAAAVGSSGAVALGELAVKRLANEVAAEIGAVDRLAPEGFARLVAMEASGELTSAQARTVLKELLATGGDPQELAARLGFEAMAADTLAGVVDDVIRANPAEWERFAGGEDKLTGFFIGKIKAATGGQADLKAASVLLRQRRGEMPATELGR